MFDTVVAAESPEPPDDGATADWPVLMAEQIGACGEALNLLAGADPQGLSESARVSALAQLAAIAAHAESVRLRYTAAVAGPLPADPREDWGKHEVAVASRLSIYSADRQVAFARDLAGRLSATHAAMTVGQITLAQALALSEGVAHLDDEVAQQIEANLLRYAYRQDLTLFKASLRRWLARLDPQFTSRATTARREAIADHRDLGDGVGELYLRGPLEMTALVDTALNACAGAAKSAQGGTSATRKLAGLAEWATRYLTSPDAPRRHGRAIVLDVCVDAPTLFGLARHPAEIPGYGFIPAAAAIQLLADGSPLRRLVIDPADGHLLHYGRTTYVVPPPLADHLIALHRTSAAPYSSVPAGGCDMDHLRPYDDGGTTDPWNVTPLERRWHRGKTHAGWTYRKDPDGSVTWTSPAGQTLRIDPHDYRLGP
ncbi:MAG TPA: DUF222 domain-containing protein [Mycobacteriales bacterium]|nr:DUF222 domain-containing protein [Mycobacteriales bacterium]